jgi:hypothetical protein
MLKKNYKLLEEIYECNAIEQAQIYFDESGEIQRIFAIIAFKYCISLPQELRKIV